MRTLLVDTERLAVLCSGAPRGWTRRGTGPVVTPTGRWCSSAG